MIQEIINKKLAHGMNSFSGFALDFCHGLALDFLKTKGNLQADSGIAILSKLWHIRCFSMDRVYIVVQLDMFLHMPNWLIKGCGFCTVRKFGYFCFILSL